MENFNKEDFRYQQAKKRVKEVKSFYIHAAIYLIVNVGLVITNHSIKDTDLLSFDNFYTAFFWGIGLLAHGLSVYLPAFILGKNWEEKKIQDLMNKNNK